MITQLVNLLVGDEFRTAYLEGAKSRHRHGCGIGRRGLVAPPFRYRLLQPCAGEQGHQPGAQAHSAGLDRIRMRRLAQVQLHVLIHAATITPSPWQLYP